MKYGSLFTGIGGFDLAFDRAGMTPVFQCEIDKNCQELLRQKWPDVELIKDVRDVKRGKSVDVIAGGFPCQDLSIAGKRAGLAGERSGLWFEFARVIDELEPRWVVIENVPGLLSSNKGRDFAVIIQWLAERGYGVAWRVFDAQYFGIPQRRRRVFIVGSLGNGSASEILFKRESGARDFAKGGKAGEGIAATLAGGSGKCHSDITSGQQDGNIIIATGRLDPNGQDFVTTRWDSQRMRIHDAEQVGPTLSTSDGKGGQRTPLVAYNIQHNDGGNHRRKDRPNGGMYVNETDKALTVGSTDLTAVMWEMSHASEAVRENGDIAPTLQRRMGTGGNQVPMVGVRRLTPTECERLQGFPDGWTEGFADSTRYRMLGNAVAVPVVEWIAKRIMK